MFYCDICAEEREWPQSISRFYGLCELCGQRRSCNDIANKYLPSPKKTTEPFLVEVKSDQFKRDFWPSVIGAEGIVEAENFYDALAAWLANGTVTHNVIESVRITDSNDNHMVYVRPQNGWKNDSKENKN